MLHQEQVPTWIRHCENHWDFESPAYPYETGKTGKTFDFYPFQHGSQSRKKEAFQLLNLLLIVNKHGIDDRIYQIGTVLISWDDQP